MFSLPIGWTATAKEVEVGGMFVNAQKVLKFFRWSLLFSITMLGGMIYLAWFASPGWRISGITEIFPMATLVIGHITFPLLCVVL